LSKNNLDLELESSTLEKLKILIKKLNDTLFATIKGSQSIETEGLEKLLTFISRVSSECHDHFSNFIPVLIKLKYFSKENNVEEILEDIYQIKFKHDYKKYCNKLRELQNNYKSIVVPELLKANLESLDEWLNIFFRFEGLPFQFITMENAMHGDISGILYLIADDSSSFMNRSYNNKTEENIQLVRKQASSYIDIINSCLDELQILNNQILGISGRTGFLELVNIPERLQEVSVTMIDKNVNYDFKGSKFGGGFAAEGGIQTGGTLIDVSSTNNLTEAAQQIQELLQQLQTQGMNENEAQKQAAQDLAKQAEQDPTLMGKLIQWSKSMADTASKTTVSEATKGVVQLALRIAGISLP
jgi:predicted RNA-binding Zn ribbon-like protein